MLGFEFGHFGDFSELGFQFEGNGIDRSIWEKLVVERWLGRFRSCLCPNLHNETKKLN